MQRLTVPVGVSSGLLWTWYFWLLPIDAEFRLHRAEQTKHSLSPVEVLDLRKTAWVSFSVEPSNCSCFCLVMWSCCSVSVASLLSVSLSGGYWTDTPSLTRIQLQQSGCWSGLNWSDSVLAQCLESGLISGTQLPHCAPLKPFSNKHCCGVWRSTNSWRPQRPC